MFKSILVPLDESERAEQALPVAIRLAHHSRSTIILLEVIPPPTEFGPYWGEPPSLVQRAIDLDLKRAANYLTRIAHSEIFADVSTETKTATGNPAATILLAVNKQGADLIVMTSHGRGGLSRWILGSVAEKVIRQAPIPVLVLRQHPLRETLNIVSQPLRALVALDGSRASEAVLSPALYMMAALASPGQAFLHLLHVLPMPSTIDKPEQLEQRAKTYLQRVSDHIQQEWANKLSLSVTWSLSSAQDVASTIVHIAQGETQPNRDHSMAPYDLLMMATHGRGEAPHWGLGSITERVLQTSKLPLLIVPSPKNSRL